MTATTRPPDHADAVAAHYDHIHRYALSFLHNEADAKDVAQDVVCAALRGKYTEQGKMQPWLIAITRNKCLDFVKSRRRFQGVEPKADDTHRFDCEHDAGVLLGRLNESDAHILKLESDGYGRREMADKLGISRATLRTRIYRARIRAKKEMGL